MAAAGAAGISADYTQAGVRQALSGEWVTPYGGQVLQSLGLSPGAAALVYGGAGLALGGSTSFLANSSTAIKTQGSNLVYRGLTAADAETLAVGGGLTAKAPDGIWSAAEHVANMGPGEGGAALNSPWISTSKSLDVAQAYDGGFGIAVIDLNKISSPKFEVWRTAPRAMGLDGLPYFRSILSQ